MRGIYSIFQDKSNSQSKFEDVFGLNGDNFVLSNISSSISYIVPDGKVLLIHGFRAHDPNSTFNFRVNGTTILTMEGDADSKDVVMTDRYRMSNRDTSAATDVMYITGENGTTQRFGELLTPSVDGDNYISVDMPYLFLPFKSGTELDVSEGAMGFFGTLHDAR